jgi:alanine racemase
MPRPIQAQIHLAAVRHNLQQIRRRASDRAVWAVVKANAYGHGIGRVLPALDAADGLALLDLDEAQRARDADWRRPILLLEGFFSTADLAAVDALRLTPVVHHEAQVAMLEAHRAHSPVDVYVKVNSGMNRLGFEPVATAAVIERLRRLAAVQTITAMTHLANADRADRAAGPAAVEAQLHAFDAALGRFDGPRSVANSAALFLHPQVGGDSVRPGIALYGATPVGGRPAAEFGLRPAMTLTSEILAVQTIAAGEPVGYGGRWVARRASRIGVVACGYADGYPRHAPDGTPVRVAGVDVPLAGRVSMDMITVDLTDAPQANVGSEVELWGAGVPIDVVAERSGTVGYELMCALAPRVSVSVER